MLLVVWSPKGGSGTSVVSAALALGCASVGPVRLVDLGGDQPAIFGLAVDPEDGVADVLARAPGVSIDALDAYRHPAAGSVALVARGTLPLMQVPPERGAELAMCLRDELGLTVVDAGSVDVPVARACIELADVTLVVLRGCYLALRRAVHEPLLGRATAAIAVTHPERPLRAREIEDVLQVPVLASVPEQADIARAVDAGVLPSRCPLVLSRAVGQVLHRLGHTDWGEAA